MSHAEASLAPRSGHLAVALPLFAAALFVGAFLLFSVQPMFTKMVLPLLGGAPSVWNTAMVFFQTVLLLAYGYAHLSARHLAPARQVGLHLAVLAVAFAVLPVAVSGAWRAPAEGAPVAWLLGLLAVSVGPPFFAVAATAPLLQRWFSRTGHAAAGDPYFLYGASNLGSILALLAYPAVIEPWLDLDRQSAAWTLAYAGLAVLIALAGAVMLRARAGAAEREDGATAPRAAPAAVPAWDETRIDGRRRLTWVALAFAPSSLLLGVTTFITTDVAAAPLLWVVPLALYLLTFVVVFARRPAIRHAWMVRAQPFAILPLALVFWIDLPIWAAVPLHLAAFFVTAMVCHGELVRRRPAARHLTEFYFWMSLGGMLGGVFNALVAPGIFSSVLEYPLVLVLACMLRPAAGDGPRIQWRDVAWPALLLLAAAVPTLGLGLAAPEMGEIGIAAYFASVGVAAYAFAERPVRFGLGIAAALVAASLVTGPGTVLARERSFFGVYKVSETADGAFRLLINGTTLHGAQYTDPARWREPLTYYGRTGPLGQVFAALAGTGRIRSVGVVGLGTGTVACYRRPGEAWTFYEIDPTVARLARDTRYFRFMSECAGDAPVIFGDARLALAGAPRGAYDLLILDAFSSDAIPMHMVTREALALYLEKLAPGGLLLFHISNRNLDLGPVLANLAADAGLVARRQHYAEVETDARKGIRMPSDWVVMARAPADLDGIADDGRWRPLEPAPEIGLWTDGFSNVLGILKW